MDHESERQSSPNMGLLQTKYEESSAIHKFALSRFYRTLDSMLSAVTAQSVLDAGSGEGHILSKFLDGHYEQIYGMDLDQERLVYSRQHHSHLPVVNGNLHHIPFPDNAFDLVICLEVLEHVGQPDKALAELFRVTRRYAICSVPNEPFWRIGNMLRGAYWSQLGNTPEHINHWSVWGFKRFMSRHFEILDVATPVTWTFILAEKRQNA